MVRIYICSLLLDPLWEPRARRRFGATVIPSVKSLNQLMKWSCQERERGGGGERERERVGEGEGEGRERDRGEGERGRESGGGER